MTWEGDADLAVLPLFEGALDADGLVVGYRPGGVQVSVDIYAQSTFPAFLLGLSSIDFGPNPESQRASAPKHGRPTISTPEEEFGGGLSATMSSFMGGDCDPESTVPCECQIDLEGTPPEGCAPCELDPESCEEEEPAYEPSPPIQRGFHVHGTESCFWHPPLLAGYNDADLDGVFDSCENALAVAMAPRLGLHPAELDASREPYFAAITVGAGIVAVFYALSYHWDMGNPLGTAGGHPGDSEFVIVTVQDEGNGYWSRKGIYTAAHEGTPGESSRWWGPVEYPAPYVPTRPLAPTVYVAVNKHASYGSVLGCEQGGTFFTFGSLDHCASNGPQEDVTAHHHANLGSYRSPIRDCVPSIAGYPGFECFWTGSYFLGWTGEEASTTAYSQHLVPRGF